MVQDRHTGQFGYDDMTKRRMRRVGSGATRAAAALAVSEEVLTRAARLGVTPERVLQELERLAFSNILHIVEWDDQKGIRVKESGQLDPEQAAAIAEIVASASTNKVYRVKLHDKKPVLEAIARHLGLLPPPPAEPKEEEPSEDEVKSARERLILELDRIAAEMDAGSSAPEPAA